MSKCFLISFFWLPCIALAQYTGTASVTQGVVKSNVANLYNCSGGRIAGVGTIKANDNTAWTVPAVVQYSNPSFPFSYDLYNSCNGHTYAAAQDAINACKDSVVSVVDSDGEIITCYVFADNYFEMYINGVPVGKDRVPYTQFNSSIVRFKAKRPFTVAMLLVDWEEHLGIGTEVNGPAAYHDGDGGMVAVFCDINGSIIATTNDNWKAQTFYTAPITDLNCPTETGNKRLSQMCSTADAADGTLFYGLHWSRPAGWMDASFQDTAWPNALVYSNQEIGVNNKPAYTNFTSIFDANTIDAQFIWSSNLILDNEVLVRYTVPESASKTPMEKSASFRVYPNPAHDHISVEIEDGLRIEDITQTSLINTLGEVVFTAEGFVSEINITGIPTGIYMLRLNLIGNKITQKILIE